MPMISVTRLRSVRQAERSPGVLGGKVLIAASSFQTVMVQEILSALRPTSA
jgi:hypothetical protein